MIGFLTGAVLAALIAALALRVRALSKDGAIAAFAVGACTFGAGGLQAAAILLAFFISSVVLTRIGRARKHALVDIAKGGPRNALQVLANGGIATVCILLALNGGPVWTLAFAGAYAAATADTWGTEIGTLAAALPRSIVNARTLATGMSGGITVAGSLAEIAGALGIALIAFGVGTASDLRSAGAIALAGVAGAVVDSVLGATIQERRWCDRCARVCENDPHGCGTATVHRSGLSWCTNDMVNALATLVGATIALAIA